MDGNMLYAEVKYDNKTKAVTLTKGHNWEFNGKSAWRSIGERWKTETSQWVGSNYLCYSCKIIFLNNPFGYEHREEQYITNPKDKILLDYNASLVGRQNASSIDNINNITDYQSDLNDNAPQNDIAKTQIATYELDYGKRKVV